MKIYSDISKFFKITAKSTLGSKDRHKACMIWKSNFLMVAVSGHPVLARVALLKISLLKVFYLYSSCSLLCQILGLDEYKELSEPASFPP